ncbi:MAG: hypothetical protein B7Z22_04855 [Hyphomonas sp. 32-62-5]|nr:MAG: hypothetical protein B7Z22_04855 [Hyphomonas sp. 32-62-5]
MFDITLARALHVGALVHWIGGVCFVTLVVLPGVRSLTEPAERARIFAAIESAFSWQAKISVTVAGLTGFYITHGLAAWGRFLDPGFWWMHAMVAIWLVFTIVLFVLEPLYLDRWFSRQMHAQPARTMAIVQRGHLVLMTLSLITVLAAVLGSHGAFY